MSTKQERRLQDRVNRFRKHLPSAKRAYELDRIAAELDGEADRMEKQGDPNQDHAGLRADALFLRRLRYDLVSLRLAVESAGEALAKAKMDEKLLRKAKR